MTKRELMDVMMFHLKNFNDENVVIDENTIHNQVVSATDGYGGANSKHIYRSVIRWTLKRYKHVDKPWPKDWMDSSVDTLSSNLL